MRKSSITSSFPIVGLLLLLTIAAFAYKQFSPKETTPSPRDKKGVDTLYYNDSAYKINFSIDTVFVPKKDTEYEERP